MIYLDLIHNVTLLVALAVGFQMVGRRLEERSTAYRLTVGLLFGAVGLMGMMTPVRFAPGVIYDGRSIVLSLAGLFCGPAALLAAAMCAAYRLFLGGAGAPVGLAVIAEATALGMALHYLRRRDARWAGSTRLLLFGLLVHAFMLALQMLIPDIDRGLLLRRIGPGVLVFFPLGFLLAARIFLDNECRREAELALRKSDERLKLSMEGAELGTWDWNVRSGECVFNARWAGMLGFALEEIEPHVRSWEGMIHPDDRPQVLAALQAHLDGGTETYESEHRVRHRSGAWVWVLDKGRVIERDPAGRPLRACGTHLDVTDRKRGEAERELLMAAIGQAGEIILITDPAGTIQYVNPAFERITGYPREEAVGRNPRFLQSGQQDAAFYAAMWRTLTAGGTWQGRFVNRRKDGALYTEEATVSPVLDPGGRTVNYVGVKSDVTRELALEQQYHQAQKLESIGRLAGGVAHDLNNLLSPILGYAEMLLEDCAPDDGRREAAEQILQAGHAGPGAGAAAPGLQPQADAGAQAGRPEPGAGGLREAAAAHHPRGHRPPDRSGPRPAAHPGGRRPARAGDHEPGGQRPGCHAGRRPADHRDLRGRAGRRTPGGPARGGARPLRPARHPRHGPRHGPRDAGPPFRALLQHQEPGARHRVGVGHRLTASSVSTEAPSGWTASREGGRRSWSTCR